MSDSLAAKQTAFARALTGTGPVPAGFDARQVDTARRALLAKRARELAFVWPILSASLGEELISHFAAFAAARATRGARRDGYDFAVWLREQHELPLAAALELAEAQLFWIFPSDGSSPLRNTSRYAKAAFPGGYLLRAGQRVRTVGRPRAQSAS